LVRGYALSACRHPRGAGGELRWRSGRTWGLAGDGLWAAAPAPDV